MLNIVAASNSYPIIIEKPNPPTTLQLRANNPTGYEISLNRTNPYVVKIIAINYEFLQQSFLIQIKAFYVISW